MITEQEEQYNHTNGKLSTGKPEDRRTASLPAFPHGGNEYGEPASLPARTTAGFTRLDIDDFEGVGPSQADYSYLKGKLAIYEADETRKQEEFDKETDRLKREWEREQEALNKLALIEIPRLVIRGVQSTHKPLEQIENKANTLIDHVAFTCEETADILKQFVEIFIPKAVFFEAQSGMLGYKRYINILLCGQVIGKIAYGSQHGRNYLQLSGTACAEVKDWYEFKHYLTILEKAKLNRLDIAADFYFGEVTLETVKEAYEKDKFKLEKARTNPIYDLRQPIGGEGYPLGWTVYIGKRTSSKMARIYHKGAEQFGKFTPDIQKEFQEEWKQIGVGDYNEAHKGEPRALMGDWVRAEIEYKAKDVELSFDMLTNRDDYFVGAYPYFKELIIMANPVRPKSIPHKLEIEEEKMWQNVRDGYGAFLTTMRASGKYTDAQILDKACNGRHSQRFIKAGGLEMVKPYNPSA